MEQDARSAGPEDPNFRRACDQCRTRKIRCDKTTPCSNCRVAMRTCSSIGVTHKPREQKQRVLISHQYEKKIDLIEERLGGIEEALRAIAANGTTSGTADHSRAITQSTPSSISYREPVQPDPDDDDDSGSAFEGELSLAAHTAFARDFLENAVRRTSLEDLPPNMQTGLSALRQLVAMKDTSASIRDMKLPMARPMPPGGMADLPMPPMKAVVTLLKNHKHEPLGVFEIACSFISIDEVLELCRKVYFCTDSFSYSTFIIVNAALYYLFADHFYQAKDPVAKADYEEYTRMCQTNLQTTMGHLPLMLPAKAESITALLLAGNYAVNIAKPSLAWQFSSAAVNLCQILGYHRESPVKEEKPGQREARTLLFWNVYILDRCLSLRLGLSSILQNRDITLPRVVDSSIVEDPWGPMLTNWIEEGDITNRIYEELYSPAALARPPAERIATARQLEAIQKRVMAQATQVREQALFGLRAINASTLIDVHLRGDEIAYQSALTLIYRAIPAPEGSPSRFTAECLDTARFAMQVHHDCMQAIEGEGPEITSVFVHWTTLLMPFAPFFVLFCYVIESSSADDLRRLFDFVESLRPVSTASEPVMKLYQLCQVLCNVAHAYAEAKSQQTATSDPINREFDIYLSALGFPPTDVVVPASGAEDALGQTAAMQTDHLGNWFSGNQQMMGLLEGDLSQFGHGPWGQ